MSDDYTPSVDEMRAAIKKSLHYLRGAYQIRPRGKRNESIREAYGTLRGFDRMIAQVRAEAWDEAIEHIEQSSEGNEA